MLNNGNFINKRLSVKMTERDNTLDLMSLSQHCVELTQYFGALSDFGGHDGSEHIADWLTLAAWQNTKKINYG
ncbi:hypothetical protein [Calothrix sp. PCC 7507]|uniref:hypothetical protein n=1 Tax=Calothrix sp. PCC 7507 TaxID=99598 RepID=UPI00029EDD97|nr:hypothetical protein [Calothrix sp. PCC 7507]AFY33527.1 hypothetical protein Cal7507_3115 [Calothrix sp. PCC 7507]